MVDRSGLSVSRRARFVVPGVVVLLVVVAVAATGSSPAGSGGARPPSQWFLDVFASVVLVLMALGTVLLVVLLVLRPQALLDQVAARERRKGRLVSSLGLLLLVLLLALAIRRFVGGEGGGAAGIDPGGAIDGAAAVGDGRYEPQFATGPLVVLLAVAAATVVATAVAMRRRPVERDGDPGLEEALASVLDDTLDDLRAERDPRRAVIAAYARLERVFAAHGVPRRPSEAPAEYLGRVLAHLEVPVRAATRLTELFATAKFSQHDVGPGMKHEAIDALETARDELRLAAEHALAARDAAQRAARERAAT